MFEGDIFAKLYYNTIHLFILQINWLFFYIFSFVDLDKFPANSNHVDYHNNQREFTGK